MKATTNYQPYSKYKPSDLEWLGNIPVHWNRSKVKYLAEYVNGLAFKPSEWSSDGVKIIRIQNLTDTDAEFNFYQGKKDEKCLVRKGDILISWSASLGVYVWSFDEYAWLNQHIFKVNLNNKIIFRNYFIWLSKWFIREMEKEVHGSTMKHITRDKFENFTVYLPNKKEQTAVADFLDERTEYIDTLIAKQERLIELLEEKRNALISHAVTKGLDPDVAMKDSGVEWLGEIPRHWDVNKLKFLANIIYSNVDKHKNEDEKTVKLCNYTDVYYNEKITSQINFMVATATEDEIKKFSLEKGDVIITKDSETPDDIAVPVHVAENFDNVLCGYHLGMMRPMPKKVNSKYLFRVFQSKIINKQFEIRAKGITRYGLGKYDLENIHVFMPSLSEQIKIANFIDQETNRIAKLVEKINHTIEKLQEYRTALISAAVTGKIDVREV